MREQRKSRSLVAGDALGLPAGRQAHRGYVGMTTTVYVPSCMPVPAHIDRVEAGE